MSIQIRKAERKKAKLKIGISGPSGSGKTYSALLLASGIAEWDRIAIIDTENGSGELYANLGAYNVVTIDAPFTPEKYIEAIEACDKSGMEVIIIDSITHEWDGKGGCLEIQEQLGGRYQDWAKVTPRHRKFIDSILQSKAHVITTVRNKQDYEMTNENGKLKVEKVGLKEVTREGFEYELTLNFVLDIRHNAKAGKDRTGLFMDQPEFVIDSSTGERLIAWANSGKADVPTPEQTDRAMDLVTALGGDWLKLELKGKKWDDLTSLEADKWIALFDQKLTAKHAPAEGVANGTDFIAGLEADKAAYEATESPTLPTTPEVAIDAPVEPKAPASLNVASPASPKPVSRAGELMQQGMKEANNK